jgi:hypothetical protein
MPCNALNVDQYFRKICCLHIWVKEKASMKQVSSRAQLPSFCFLLDLMIDPEYGGNMFLQIVS